MDSPHYFYTPFSVVGQIMNIHKFKWIQECTLKDLTVTVFDRISFIKEEIFVETRNTNDKIRDCKNVIYLNLKK